MVNEETTTRYYNWTVTQATGAPDGFSKPMLVVNGIFPGPTIEANEGDRIVVNVTNMMPNATTLHWHGLYQRGTPYYDGTIGITQCGIPPGQSMVYNYTVANWTGSTWWHAHSATQYSDGIVGALVVHSKNESVPSYDGDLALQLSDLYHVFSPIALQEYFTPGGLAGIPGTEPVPDGGTINGIGQYGSYNSSFFNVTLEANKTYRLRLINPGTFVAMTFSVDNHMLTVIEGDGTAVDPYPVSSVSTAVGQRYSVLLTTNQTAGAYFMRAGLDQGAFGYNNPATQLEIRGVIRYGVENDTMPDMSLLNNPPLLPVDAPKAMDTGNLVPVGGGPAPEPTFNTSVTISMQYPANTADYLGHYLAFLNSTSWEPLTGTASLLEHLGNDTADGSASCDGSQLMTIVNEVHVVQILVQNNDDGDHPFHLHGYKFWVLNSGAGDYTDEAIMNTTPMLRDTVVIPAYSWIFLRFVADNAGYWAFHCHIQFHMAAGLLMQFNVLPSVSQQYEIPQYMLDQCSM
ncbi:multicopper oxidase [Sparassis latifolia]